MNAAESKAVTIAWDKGPLWVHEIKHGGFRVVARKEGKRVRLYSRPGNDLTSALPADRLHPQNAESADQTMIAPSRSGWPRLLDRGGQPRSRFP
jgi:ATP-dependent DNA ligase